MGGDAFQGTQRLSLKQYDQILNQAITSIQPFCLRIQPYIPLPQKQSHGDIDILVILKQSFTLMSFLQVMKCQKHIINHNDTLHVKYRNKQLDFKRVECDNQFQLMQFYKSYSGVGAFLGLTLPSKDVKLTDLGLVCMFRQKHLKLQHYVSQNVQEIITFYGLDYQQYVKGFCTLKQLIEWITKCKFFDWKVFAKPKRTTKLIDKVVKWVEEGYFEDRQFQSKNQVVEDPLQYTLKYFKGEEAFGKAIEAMIENDKRNRLLAEKFNAMHIMKQFNVKEKYVNGLKAKFNKHFGSRELTKDYIQETQLEEILGLFQKVCFQELKEIANKEEEKIVKNNGKVKEKNNKQQKQEIY